MGYYVTLIEHNAMLRKQDLDEAYRIMCELNNDNSKKTGGRWPREDKSGPHNGVWFAWMDWNYPETCHNAKEILQELGFDVYETDNGDLIPEYYDSKTGAEDIFLNSLAKLWVSEFNDDSDPYFAWRGEDGTMWRIRFADGKAVGESAHIVWR